MGLDAYLQLIQGTSLQKTLDPSRIGLDSAENFVDEKLLGGHGAGIPPNTQTDLRRGNGSGLDR